MAERRLREAPGSLAPAEPVARAAQRLDGGGRHLRFLAAVGIGIVALHAAGLGLVSSLWGAHAYAFFPPWVLLVGIAPLVPTWLLIRRGVDWTAPWRARWPRSPLLRSALLFVSALAVFWIFRARHLLLGDGLVLSRGVLVPQPLHPLEPLAMLAQQVWCSWTLPWFRGGRAEADAAWQALALGSAVAGALFVVIVDGIVTQISHAARVPETDAAARLLSLLVVLAQGYVQVFFGYVENYALLVVALAYYVRCALSYLNGRGSLPAVVFSGLATLCVHLSAAVLLPSLAFVVAVGFQRRRWRSFWSELAAGGLAAVLVLGLLSQLGFGYDLGRTLLATIGRVATPESDGPASIGSGAHALNVLNEQILLGPVGLAMIGAGLAGLRASRGHAGVRRFLLALAAPCLVVALIAGDSNLGYARNWDLLAPTGFVFALTGIFLLLEQAGTARLRNAALALALALSLFHTAPWIAVNASPDRGVARFASLPLGGGRTESTLGCWFFRQGNYPEAERWLDRAIVVNPRNPRAHYWAGRVYTATGRIEEAAAAFDRAHQIRPDLVSFRLAWINSQVRLGKLEPALRESDELLRSDRSNPRRWALMGAVLGELGRSHAAREALERASLLEPGEARTERLTRMLGPDGSSLRIPSEDLDALTGM